MKRSTRIHLAALLIPAAVSGQSTCKPDRDRPEAKILAFFAGPLTFSGVPGIAPLGRGQVSVIGELAFLPKPPAEITRSSGVCGFSKPENSDLAPVFPRPRIAFGMGGGLVGEVSFLPPVTVADATPHLGGFALSWTPERRLPVANASLTLRAHATMGGVDGPITCPRQALQQASAAADCFGTEPSDDTYEPNAMGVEAIAHATVGEWGWQVGAGMTQLGSRLKVNFTNGNGLVDNNVVEISFARFAMMAGAHWQAARTLALSAQVYSVPGDATTTARLGIAWRAR